MKINPNNVKTERLDRQMKVKDDGSVEIIETERTTVTMLPQQFQSWKNKIAEQRDNIKQSLTDESRKNAEEALQKAENDLEELAPFIKESEENAKKHYEKLKTDGMISRIKKELEKPLKEINLEYMNAVWNNIKDNEKEIKNALTKDELNKMMKIKKRFLEKNRGK